LVPSFDSGDDFVWVLGPGKGFWVCVGVVEEAVDGIFEFRGDRNTPCLRRLFVSLAKKPSMAFVRQCSAERMPSKAFANMSMLAV
jgi:hypothetical protein